MILASYARSLGVEPGGQKVHSLAETVFLWESKWAFKSEWSELGPFSELQPEPDWHAGGGLGFGSGLLLRLMAQFGVLCIPKDEPDVHEEV